MGSRVSSPVRFHFLPEKFGSIWKAWPKRTQFRNHWSLSGVGQGRVSLSRKKKGRLKERHRLTGPGLGYAIRSQLRGVVSCSHADGMSTYSTSAGFKAWSSCRRTAVSLIRYEWTATGRVPFGRSWLMIGIGLPRNYITCPTTLPLIR